MPEQRESRVWGDQGTEPDPGDETYSGSERPIAEYDNWAMWSATTDIKTLFDWLDGVETDLNNHTSSSSGVHGVGSADVASTNDVSSIQSSADVSHDNTTGGTSGTPHDHADPDDPVTQFDPGDVADGEVLGNSGGQLASVDAGKSDEEVQDIVATLINAAGNLSSTYDDANDKLTLDTSGLNTEEVQDAVASLVTAGSNLSWSYDDASDTLTVSLADSISVDTLEADDSITDPSGYTHDKLTRTLGIPTPTAYFSGPAHGEGSSAFHGATLAPDGRVIFAPYNSSNVGIFDPNDGTYTSGPAHGEGSSAFRGATLAPDGRVIFAPYDSSNVGIFDPNDGTYTSGPTHGEGSSAFLGATLASDGRVVFAPFGSSNVGIVSQLLDFATASGANK